jgi:hypothetical protein
MPSYNDITNRLEAAALAVHTANPVSGLTATTGQSGSTRTLPSVVFYAEQGEEFPQSSGNYKMQLTCRVESSADQTSLSTHRGYFAAIADMFTDSAIATTLSSSLSDFQAIGVNNPRFRHTVEDRANVSELTLEVYCCAADLV